MPSNQAVLNTNSNIKLKANNSEGGKISTSNQVLTDTTNQHQEVVNLTEKQHLNSTGNKTPQEQPEFIKQALIIIEKKVRNLEKRRMKLDEYKSDQKRGEKLNEDQLNAVSKYDEVIRTLELTRELEKQFIVLANDAMKQQKKQAKKEQLERDEAIKDKLKEAYKFISVLNKFNEPSVRSDFLTETNRAAKLSENELNMLEAFNNLIKPCELGDGLDQSTSEVADHLISLVDGKNKPIGQLNDITYLDLRKLFEKIISSSYWISKLQSEETVEKKSLSENSSDIYLENKETPNQINDQIIESDDHNLENRVIEQITSEDFILVSTTSNLQLVSNDTITDNFHKINTVQSQQKTFFTTLNPADLATNFLNRSESTNEEGLNFLQDSEVQNHSESYIKSIVQNNENNENSFKQQRSINRDNNGSRGYQKHRYNDDRRNGNNLAQRGGQSFNNRNQNGGNSNFRSNNQNRTDHRNIYYRGSSNNNNNNAIGRNSNQRASGYRNQEQFQPMIIQN